MGYKEFDLSKLSRRDVLKAAAIATADTLFLDTLLSYYRDHGPEGNIIQRQETYFTISRNHPDLLLPWLKFNAAACYAKLQGWDFAEKSMLHFLYGRGENVDATDQLTSHMKKNYPRTPDNPDPAANFITGYFTKSNGWESQLDIHDDKFHLNAAVTGIDKNLFFALGRFRFNLTGKVISASTTPEHLSYYLDRPSFQINDVYDWLDNPIPFDVPFNLRQEVATLLESINVRLPDAQIANLIPPMETSVSMSDGQMLESSPYGHPFKIFTQPIQSNSPVIVSLPKKYTLVQN